MSTPDPFDDLVDIAESMIFARMPDRSIEGAAWEGELISDLANALKGDLAYIQAEAFSRSFQQVGDKPLPAPENQTSTDKMILGTIAREITPEFLAKTAFDSAMTILTTRGELVMQVIAAHSNRHE